MVSQTQSWYRRVGNILVYGNVEFSPEQVRQLFDARPEKIAVYCKPNVCEFDFNGVVVRAQNEVINSEIQDSIAKDIDFETVVVWLSDNFGIVRRPGVIKFLARFYDDPIRKIGEKKAFLGAIVLLPDWFVKRLNTLTSEEEQKLMKWLLSNAVYICHDMIVCDYIVEFPINEYEELERIIGKVGNLDSVELEGECSLGDVVRYCSVNETTDYRYGKVEWLSYDPFRHGRTCTFVLRPG